MICPDSGKPICYNCCRTYMVFLCSGVENGCMRYRSIIRVMEEGKYASVVGS